jgi:hypothetical protein
VEELRVPFPDSDDIRSDKQGAQGETWGVVLLRWMLGFNIWGFFLNLLFDPVFI